MESQPQNPEFRNNPENFHPCWKGLKERLSMTTHSKFFLKDVEKRYLDSYLEQRYEIK